MGKTTRLVLIVAPVSANQMGRVSSRSW